MIFRYHLFKNKLPLMNRALDAYSLRQRTTAKNIANATSPHYRPERVQFEELFHQQQSVAKGETTSAVHIPIGRDNRKDLAPELVDREIPEPEVYFSGETHVNIDKEMSELAENQIRFRFVSRSMKKYFQSMTNSITGNIR